MAISKRKRAKVWSMFGGRCAYCGCTILYEDMEVDHIVSKSFHEQNELDNMDRIENLYPSCHLCNTAKGDDSLEQFKRNLKQVRMKLERNLYYRLALKYKVLKASKFNGVFFFEKMKR